MANYGSATKREETPHETDSNTQTPTSNRKIELLAEMICSAGEDPAGALLVLMATLEEADDAAALINDLKHLAFTRCGELNAHGVVDAQVAMLEDKLLATQPRRNFRFVYE